jgi:hypothetical protein
MLELLVCPGTASAWTMATGSRSNILFWTTGGAVLLLLVNVVVAVVHTGSRAGQTYHWVCRKSGAELSYNPSAFGSVRLTPGRSEPGTGRHWELVEPRTPSPLLPWNWLTVLLHPPVPDAEAVIRQQPPN